MILNLPQAAARLGVSPETLRRWSRQGVLGMRSASGEIEFEEKELRAWAKRQGLRLREESRPCWPLAVESSERPLTTALRLGGVFPFFEGETSEQVLRAMVELAPISDEPTRIQLHEQLQAREALSSTGLGHGIALPHPRTPSRNFASEPTVLLALLNKPVDWSAIDGQEVGAVFLLLNPDPQSHLRILSRISFLLRDENFIKSLKLDADPEQLLEMVALLEPDCA